MTLRALLPAALIAALTACSTPAKQADTTKPDEDGLTTPAPTSAAKGAALRGTYTVAHTIEIMGQEGEMVEEEVEDCMWVEPGEDGSLSFSFSLIQVNGHSCTMSGQAVADGPDQWIHSDEAGEGAERPCKLVITADATSIDVEDVEEGCRQHWCGARASIGTSSFDRATRKDENTCEPMQ